MKRQSEGQKTVFCQLEEDLDTNVTYFEAGELISERETFLESTFCMEMLVSLIVVKI